MGTNTRTDDHHHTPSNKDAPTTTTMGHKRKSRKQGDVASRYLSSILTDRPKSGSVSTKHTANTEQWESSSSYNNKDELFGERAPRAPRHSPPAPVVVVAERSPRRSRTRKLQRSSPEEKEDDDNDSGVKKSDSLNESSFNESSLNESSLNESSMVESSTSTGTKATSFGQAMDKGIEMILASTSCAPTQLDSTQQSPPTKMTRRKNELPQETRDKFQSIQARFWKQNVSRRNIPPVSQPVTPGRAPTAPPQQQQRYPLSPTQSELTGAPTEIATNCAVDVVRKRTATATTTCSSADELESLLCLSPYEKKPADGVEPSQQTRSQEQESVTATARNDYVNHHSGNDLSLPSLDDDDDDALLTPTPMQRRTFTVATKKVDSPPVVAAQQSTTTTTASSEQSAPDPIFSSKSAAPTVLRRTIGYEKPTLLESTEDVMEESNMTPMERLRSGRASSFLLPEATTATTTAVDDPPGTLVASPQRTVRRRSIADAWNHAQHKKTMTTPVVHGRRSKPPRPAPPLVKELIDDGTSVGVQSIRSMFEPKQSRGHENTKNGVKMDGGDNDDDDDTASVKSLRELFEVRSSEVPPQPEDDAGSVKSLRGRYESPAKHPKHANDAEVGRLRALFDAKVPRTSSVKRIPPIPPTNKSAVSSRSSSIKPRKLSLEQQIPTQHGESVEGDQGTAVSETGSPSSNKTPSPTPGKIISPQTKSRSTRVLGYWQEKSSSNGPSSEEESELAESKLQGSDQISPPTSQHNEECQSLDHPPHDAVGEHDNGCDEIPGTASSSMSMTSSQRSGNPAWMGHRDKVLSRHTGSIGNSFLSFEGNPSSIVSSPRRKTPARSMGSAPLDTSYHSSPPRIVESSDSESESSDFSDGVTLDASIADVSVLTDPTGVANSRVDPRASPTPLSERVSGTPRSSYSTKHSEASSSQPTEAAAPLIANILRRMPFSDELSTTKSRETPVKRVWSQSSDWETTSSSVGRNVAFGYGPLDDSYGDEVTGWDLHRVEAIFPVSPNLEDSKKLNHLDVWEVFGSTNSWSDPPMFETPPRTTTTNSSDSPPGVMSSTPDSHRTPQSTASRETSPGEMAMKMASTPNQISRDIHAGDGLLAPVHSSNEPSLHSEPAVSHQHTPPRDIESSVCDTAGSEFSQSSLSSRVAKALQRRREAKEKEKAKSDPGVPSREYRFADEVQSISTTPLSLVAQAARWRKKSASRRSEFASQSEELAPLSPPKRSQSTSTRDFFYSNTSPPRSPISTRMPVEAWEASTPTRTNTTSALCRESSRTVSDFPIFLLNLEEDDNSLVKQHDPSSVAGSSSSVQSGSSAPSPRRRTISSRKEPASCSTSLFGVPGHHDATTYLPKYAVLRTRLRSLRASRLRRTVAKSGYVASPKGVIEEQVVSHRIIGYAYDDDDDLRIPFGHD